MSCGCCRLKLLRKRPLLDERLTAVTAAKISQARAVRLAGGGVGESLHSRTCHSSPQQDKKKNDPHLASPLRDAWVPRASAYRRVPHSSPVLGCAQYPSVYRSPSSLGPPTDQSGPRHIGRKARTAQITTPMLPGLRSHACRTSRRLPWSGLSLVSEVSLIRLHCCVHTCRNHLRASAPFCPAHDTCEVVAQVALFGHRS